VKPVAAYGSGIWPMTEMDMRRMNTWERNILRIYGPVVEQETWRIRNNQAFREPYEDSETVTDVKKQRLEWKLYLVRMDGRRVVRKQSRNRLQRHERKLIFCVVRNECRSNH
jgi:hypothetical protein